MAGYSNLHSNYLLEFPRSILSSTSRPATNTTPLISLAMRCEKCSKIVFRNTKEFSRDYFQISEPYYEMISGKEVVHRHHGSFEALQTSAHGCDCCYKFVSCLQKYAVDDEFGEGDYPVFLYMKVEDWHEEHEERAQEGIWIQISCGPRNGSFLFEEETLGKSRDLALRP